MSFDCYTTIYFSTAVSFETMMARVTETLKVPPFKPIYWKGKIRYYTVSLLKLSIDFMFDGFPNNHHGDGHVYQYKLDIGIAFPRTQYFEHFLYVLQVGRFWSHLFANKYDDLVMLTLDPMSNCWFYSEGTTHPQYDSGWDKRNIDENETFRRKDVADLDPTLLKRRSPDSIDPSPPSLSQTATIFIRASDQVRDASQHSFDVRERLYGRLLYVMKAPLFTFDGSEGGYQTDTFHLNIRFAKNDVEGATALNYPYEVEGERYDCMLKLSLLEPPQTHRYDTQYLICMAKYWSRMIEWIHDDWGHDKIISEVVATYGLSHVVYDSRREYSKWSLDWEASLPDQHRKQERVADECNRDTPPELDE